ncbi:AAA family ATPase [Vibrio sp. YYF0003]|uniref:AAA family ATPase n=1 Tax=Vibrio sp. YYF0003 TaxID=3116646 RepID=UPI002EA5AD54|nr:AAA family ATPase [Vibrio sp. YYF0003]
MENTKERSPYFINKIEASGLLGKRNIMWELQKVSVLVGPNGCGKSTLLKLIYEALLGPDYEESSQGFAGKYDDFQLTLNNDMVSKINVNSSDDTNAVLKELIQSAISHRDSIDDENKEIFSKLIEALDNKSDSIKFSGKLYSGKSDFMSFNGPDGSTLNTLTDNINVEYISTFDMLMLSKEEQDEYSSKGEHYSQLDVMIRKELSKLSRLILTLTNKSSQNYNSSNSISIMDHHSQYLTSVNSFVVKINELFSSEGKKVVIEEDGNLSISCLGEKISTIHLSSGEKQLIFVLLKVLNSTNKPAIIMLDEPEISMHLKWQEGLLDAITTIHPNSQIIVASHSPALVMKGWINNLVDIEDITVNL